MGKPAPAKQGSGEPYRDVTDADAISMHTTPDDYDYDDVPDLPSYDDSVAGASGISGIPEEPAPIYEEQDRYAVIQTPEGNGFNRATAGNGKTTTARINEELNDPDQLYAYITDYLRLLPPNPIIKIHGSHQTVRRNKDGKKETGRDTDFDFCFSLQHHLKQARPGTDESWWKPQVVSNGDKKHRGGWRATRAPGYKQDIEVGSEPTPDLKDWCRDFCNSKSWLKVFRVERNLVGLDEAYLTSGIFEALRATHYRGHIQITFPTEDKNVDIYSPHWINRWRISWIRYIFYFTFLWLFTWPILFFMTKRWNVYRVDWLYSRKEGDRRNCVHRLGEAGWMREHRTLIGELAMSRCHGDASQEPTNVIATYPGRDGPPQAQTGNETVNSAVSLIQGGLSAWDAVRGRGDRYGAGWGADEH